MTEKHTALLTVYLKAAATETPGQPHRVVLFYDLIDKRRIDISVWWEKSDGNIYMAGDLGEEITWDEVDLIDEAVLATAAPEDSKTRLTMQLQLRISKTASGQDRFSAADIQSLVDAGQVIIQPAGIANYLMIRTSDGAVIAEIEQFTQPKTF